MPQLWEVVGGADKGGIIVREGKTTASATCEERLSTGAILEEIELEKERLHFKRLTGTGPPEGWISIKLPGRELASRIDGDAADYAGGGGGAADAGADAGDDEEEPQRVYPPFKAVSVPQIEYMEIRDLAVKNEPGDYYGIKFPHSLAQLQDKEFGAAWLTKAFHKSGVLSKSNAVTKILEGKEFVGGGAGLKAIIKVEYKKDKPYLHKDLFIKLPHPPKGSDRYYVSCMWGHDRPETIFNIWLEKSVPFKVPKFYFADICASTTNFILITERINMRDHKVSIPKLTNAKAHYEASDFKVGDFEPAYDKYLDWWQIRDQGREHYFLSCKALGKMAGYHKCGKLHPQVNDMFPMPGPAPPVPQGIPGNVGNMEVGKVDQLVRFVTGAAAKVMPDEVKDAGFLEKWKGDVLNYMNYPNETGLYLSGGGAENPLDYVGLTHNNLQIDNAFFYHDDGGLQVGLLDWGVLACGPLAGSVQGCISGATVEVLLEKRDDFLRAFIDSYAENGGPTLDFERFKMMSNLNMMGWSSSVTSNVSQVLKHTKQKEWDSISEWTDEKLINRFQTRAHTTQFKYSLQIWKAWDLAEVFKQWTQQNGLPENKW
uniref:Uncharacterized protein n=1 Tax=Alexandrium andersonii TaxID=327968 RepID=A0A7S2FSA5_9DINO|mmetsp:Transcript_32007/g.72862  ORF Transcript_32007/g.72862 Transcript_32007/m.72862 type:complete len:599 (+) Transcript_32007:3-1799(+)